MRTFQESQVGRPASMPYLTSEWHMSTISKAKSEGEDAEEYGRLHPQAHETQRVFSAYESRLRQDKCLDFDDLLNNAVRLFRAYPKAVENIQHVLIDEFQDTNVIQYQLMKLFASARKCVSIVGDPDQSIYGWRNADIGNLDKMLKDFDNVKQIFLEQNYRSTGAILKCALAVVTQDPKRIKRSLFTSNTDGTQVVLKQTTTADGEARFIAEEIQRLIAHTGGCLKYNDFAILLRSNAMSRSIEQQLQYAKIPSRMLGGSKFFDRVEVKDLLAYLRLAENPFDVSSFSRVVNSPKRGIGPKTIDSVLCDARKRNIDPVSLCDELSRGTGAKLQKLDTFVKAIKYVRTEAAKNTDDSDKGHVEDIIPGLCRRINYEEHLKKTYAQDHESRWENILELISFATLVSEDKPSAGQESNDDFAAEDATSESTTELQYFLQVTSLTSDATSNDDSNGNNEDKVTISTLHTAKGLEYPVVFVCGVEDGSIPHSRSTETHQIDEERRLLYVGMTRAKVFLYLSRCEERMFGGQMSSSQLSQFVRPLYKAKAFANFGPQIDVATRKDVVAVLGRPMIDEEKVKELVAKLPVSMVPQIGLNNNGTFYNHLMERKNRMTGMELEATAMQGLAMSGFTSVSSQFGSARTVLNGQRLPYQPYQQQQQQNDQRRSVALDMVRKPASKPTEQVHVIDSDDEEPMEPVEIESSDKKTIPQKRNAEIVSPIQRSKPFINLDAMQSIVGKKQPVTIEESELATRPKKRLGMGRMRM